MFCSIICKDISFQKKGDVKMYLNGACYLRVSTDDQLEYSIDAQLKLIKNYAKQNNIILTKEYIFVDEGISGKRAEKRPEFMKMVATAKIKPKPFDVILVHKFDRFARSREDSVVYKSLLRKECDIKVISITESIEDDKFSVILEAMLEAMAEYYSLNLAEEVKKGMTEKAERGEPQTVPPFGYKMENKQFVIDEEEAVYIRYIFETFASEELGMRKIAIKLNDLGLRTHRGNKFENRTIEYILNNPVYIGKIRWNPTGKTKRYDYSNPNLIIKQGKHEPLISIEIWGKCQEIIKKNKELYKPREKPNARLNTWLKGLVHCSDCNKMLVSNSQFRLQCNGYLKGQCKSSQSIRYDILEQLVAEQLKETYQNKLDINIVPKTSDVDTSNEYDIINISLEKLVNREERIIMAYQDGIDTLDEYKQHKEKIGMERTKLIEQLKLLKEGLTNIEKPNDNIYQRIGNVYELLTDDTIDLKIKHETAHFLIDDIVFSKKDKTLKLTYK
jgi:DNA invertase Pin-like site-specific DNA recombinase